MDQRTKVVAPGLIVLIVVKTRTCGREQDHVAWRSSAQGYRDCSFHVVHHHRASEIAQGLGQSKSSFTHEHEHFHALANQTCKRIVGAFFVAPPSKEDDGRGEGFKGSDH